MTKTSRVAVVLDTSVLLVILPKHSRYRPIFDKLLTGAFNLVISNEILMEYEEQITERYDLQTSQDLMIVLSILPNIQKVIPYFHWRSNSLHRNILFCRKDVPDCVNRPGQPNARDRDRADHRYPLDS